MKKEKERSAQISRREFIRDAGLIVGGATIGSMALINACGGTTTVTAQGTTTTKTVTASGGVTTVTTTAPGTTVTKVVEAVSATNTINLKVNGNDRSVSVSATDTLRDVLREQLGCLSIKDMCSGFGACGSCSVIMNGRPILSCMSFACECDGAVIETAEGIAAAKHPLVDAYVVNHCMQCGYCTPGFIVTSKALLDKNPKPTEDDIREILGGNICRCGTYPAHIRAILEVAK